MDKLYTHEDVTTIVQPLSSSSPSQPPDTHLIIIGVIVGIAGIAVIGALMYFPPLVLNW